MNDPFELRGALVEHRGLHQAMLRQLSTFGVLCFSRTWTSTLLWSQAVDQHEHLVQEPRISESTLTSLQPPSVVGAKLSAPLPNGFVRHDDASFGQEVLDISKAQAVSVVDPHGVTDDVRRKAMPQVAGLSSRHCPGRRVNLTKPAGRPTARGADVDLPGSAILQLPCRIFPIRRAEPATRTERRLRSVPNSQPPYPLTT